MNTAAAARHWIITLATAGLTVACSQAEPPTPPVSSVPVAAPAPVATTPVPTPTVPGDPYEKGLDKAASAKTLSQSAQTKEDWDLVISQWQRAIAFMQAVPKSSPDYKAAQKLLPDYQRSLIRSQQLARQGNRPVVTARKPDSDADEEVVLIAGGRQDTAALESEAIGNLNSLNQQQIEFLTKQKKFATNLQELGSNVAATTATFTYRTGATGQMAISTATAKQDKLASYTAAVFMVKGENNQTTTKTIVCKTEKPAKTPPAAPSLTGQEMRCPAGSTPAQ
jgi:hypothetical protein